MARRSITRISCRWASSSRPFTALKGRSRCPSSIFESLWRQYRRCRANKRNSLHQLAFEVDAEAQLLALGADLRAHGYRPGTSVCFVTGGPKPREVFAAAFRDRVVHHLLVSHHERLFEPRFIQAPKRRVFAVRRDQTAGHTLFLNA